MISNTKGVPFFHIHVFIYTHQYIGTRLHKTIKVLATWHVYEEPMYKTPMKYIIYTCRASGFLFTVHPYLYVYYERNVWTRFLIVI